MKLLLLLSLLTALLHAAAIQDMMDRKVHVTRAERIVALGPGALRLAVYMGLQSRLVGMEQIERRANNYAPYRTFVPRDLPIVAQGGAGKLPNYEALIAAKPDLILTSFLSREQIDLITAKTGIPVVALSYGSSYGGRSGEQKIDAVKGSLELLGVLTQQTPRAQALIAFMQSQQQRLLALGLKGKQAYIAGLGYKGAQGITSSEADYLPFEMLGVKNALHLQGSGHRFIKVESLIEAAPSYMFVDAMGQGIVAQERAQKPWLFTLLERKAVFKGLLASNYYNANIENLFANAWLIAKTMGADVNATAQTQAIYQTFLGADAVVPTLP